MRRAAYREPGGKSRIPILDDVSRGTGGIAGGKFLFVNDTENPTYVVHSGTATAGLRLSSPGTSGNYASTPDSATLDITGDIDIRILMAPNDWTPSAINGLASKWVDATQRSFVFNLNTNGTFSLFWSSTGANLLSSTSTAATGFDDGSPHWIRVTLDVDNGASGRTTTFYTSEDGTTWTQLGATVVSTTTSIFASTSALAICTDRSGGGTTFLEGKLYRAQIYSGIDGTLAADFNPNDTTAGDTSFASIATGETWTINGTAAIESSVTGSQIALATTASSTDDAYNGYAIEITSGTGSGQDHQKITDYDGTLKIATLSGAWVTTPDTTSTYRIINRGY